MFEVGDILRVRDWDDMERQFGCNIDGDIDCEFTFTNEMSYMCGMTFTVANIDNHSREFSSVEGIEENYAISSDMLEYLIEDNRGDVECSESDILKILKPRKKKSSK